jgi:hypothetical protein
MCRPASITWPFPLIAHVCRLVQQLLQQQLAAMTRRGTVARVGAATSFGASSAATARSHVPTPTPQTSSARQRRYVICSSWLLLCMTVDVCCSHCKKPCANPYATDKLSQTKKVSDTSCSSWLLCMAVGVLQSLRDRQAQPDKEGTNDGYPHRTSF